jgi:hypothetical protein
VPLFCATTEFFTIDFAFKIIFEFFLANQPIAIAAAFFIFNELDG